MTDVRKAILKGKCEAARLHHKFNMRDRIEQVGGRINVFGTLVECGLPLLFRPLDGLLGVYMDDPIPGVLVTTKRPLSVQRFTGAHELGHARLGHSPSLDDDLILRRSLFSKQKNYKQEEREADAFAVEFMMPPWLFATHFERHSWDSRMMVDPITVYQLSLRLGASYEATCRSLVRPGVEVISRAATTKLLRIKPKTIKETLLGGYRPPDWWGDVWILTRKDEGMVIEGSRSDLFVLQLTEHTSAGYLWNFEELNEAGFAIVRDERTRKTDETVGGPVKRSIVARSMRRQRGEMALVEQRPWQKVGKSLAHFRFSYDLTGPEEEGWSQAERRLFEAA